MDGRSHAPVPTARDVKSCVKRSDFLLKHDQWPRRTGSICSFCCKVSANSRFTAISETSSQRGGSPAGLVPSSTWNLNRVVLGYVTYVVPFVYCTAIVFGEFVTLLQTSSMQHSQKKLSTLQLQQHHQTEMHESRIQPHWRRPSLDARRTILPTS